jgi:NTP pyrophosphatase (non-canonical NTP hydrolase)
MVKKETLEKIIAFRDDRDWKQFHTVKDLCLGLNIEVSELQEIFLWKSQEQIEAIKESNHEKIGDELADIFNFIAYLCNDLNIDLEIALQKKIKLNNEKYPVNKSKGNNKKYSEL